MYLSYDDAEQWDALAPRKDLGHLTKVHVTAISESTANVVGNGVESDSRMRPAV
jgi:hypothetical protein